MVDYIQKVRHSSNDSKELRENSAGDQVEVQWSSGDWARLHITVVHAAIILLTYGGFGIAMNIGSDSIQRHDIFTDEF